MRRLLVLALAAAGCGDVCANFDGQTCIALEVQGPSALTIDQLGVSIDQIFTERLSPQTPRGSPVHLPVRLAILPGDVLPPAGLNINVRAFRDGGVVGVTQGFLRMLKPKEHRPATITLSDSVGGPGPDFAGVDFAGADLAGVDLAGADLSHPISGPAFTAANGGLFGGSVRHLLTWVAGDTAFAGTDGAGLFKTSDFGATWAPVNNGLDILFVESLTMDPLNGDLYVGGQRQNQTNGVFRSQNGGQSWNLLVDHVALTLLVTYDSLADKVILIGADDGVVRSSDDGKSFTPVNNGLTDLVVESLVADDLNKGTVFAGTSQQTVFTSADFGGTWTGPLAGITIAGGLGVRALQFDPHTRDLVALTGDGLFSKPTSTSTFAAYSPTPLNNTIAGQAMAFVQSATPDLYVAGDGLQHLDGNKTAWSEASSGISDSRDLFALAIDVNNPQKLYTSSLGGISTTTNGGASWGDAINGLANLAMFKLAIDPKNPSTLYGGSQHSGMWKTTNGGVTWSHINNGLSPETGISAIAVDPSNPSTIYIGTQDTNLQGLPQVLMKSTDSGSSWNQIDSSSTGALMVDPNNSQIVFAGGDTTGQAKLRRSTNGGTSFQASDTGLPDFVFGLAIVPNDSQLVWASTLRNAVFSSGDGGMTWNASSTGITETQINSISINQADPTHLYASGFNSVYFSTDGGGTWFPASSGIVGKGFSGIQAAPSGSVYVGGGFGPMRSDDGGATWMQLTQAVLWTVYDVAIDPKALDTVYFAYLQGPSVLKTTTGGR